MVFVSHTYLHPIHFVLFGPTVNGPSLHIIYIYCANDSNGISNVLVTYAVLCL